MSQKSTYAIAPALVALSLTLAGCGGGGSVNNQAQPSPSTAVTPSQPATTTASASASGTSEVAAHIRQNWELFFSGKTPPAKKITLLQNGQQFAPVIQAQSKSTLAQGTSAKVSSVTQTDQNTAKVTYGVLINGSPALPDQTGTAVLVDGVWEVSDQSFCSLLSLQGAAPPMCPVGSPGPSASSSG